MDAKRVIVIGARFFAEEVSDICRQSGYAVAGWIETFDRKRANPAADPPIVWIDEQAAFEPDLPVVVGIARVDLRRGTVERLLDEGRRLVSVVHPTAVIGGETEIEDGCVIFPGVNIGTRSRVGAGTIVNRGATIGHHTTVGRHCFVGPGATIAGLVNVGDYASVGMNAAVRDETSVGAGAFVGGGAVTVKDVPAGLTVVGVPARPIRRWRSRPRKMARRLLRVLRQRRGLRDGPQ